MSRAAGGDHDAWALLVDRYTPLVSFVARGYQLSAAECADVSQTTWLRLVENLDRIEDPQAVGVWLAMTTRRECLKLLRRRGTDRPVA